MKIEKISVVTVCLNARDTIRLTLESVRSQSFPEIEHVIIDGGSIDGTQDIAREYKPGYFVSETDRGVYDAMDKGAKASTGDIVIFLNAGDTFFDDDVSAEVAEFFEKSNADIVFGNIMPVYLRPNDVHDHGAFKAGVPLDLSYMRNRSQLYDESIHHQATFYRRWIFDECTFTGARKASGEYNLLLNAVMKKGATVKHTPTIISRFVLGGISTRNFEVEWGKYVEARNILRKIYFPAGKPTNLIDHNEFQLQAAGTATPEDGLLRQSQPHAAPPSGRGGGLIRRAYERIMLSVSSRIINALIPHIDILVHRRVELLNHALEHRLSSHVYSHALGTVERIEVALQKCIQELETSNGAKYQDHTLDLGKAIKSNIERSIQEFRAQIDADVQSHAPELVERIGSEFDRQIGALGGRIEASLQSHMLGTVEGIGSEFDGQIGALGGRIEASLQSHMLGAIERIGSEFERQAREMENHIIHNVLMEVANLHRRFDELSKGKHEQRFEDAGFKVFSQWDEDGLIQYLVSRLPECPKRFVEFGVGDYTEANTRLLLERHNWSGLVIDSSEENLQRIRTSPYFWRHSLVAINAFVTRENINDLLASNGVSGDIGLLSIDVDGVDYWIWDAINVVSPQIVVCEYNGGFGSKAKITIPYRPDFERAKANSSMVYAGASLGALSYLGQKKGYTLVGTNIGGNNAFFVRDDVFAASDIRASENPFTRPRFREARNPDGTLSFLDISDAMRLVSDLPVIDVVTGSEVRLGDVAISYE